MRATSGALGIAAAAALSSAGLAAPCTHNPVTSHTASVVSCTADGTVVAPLSSEATSGRAFGASEMLDDDLDAVNVGDTEIFSDAGIKITRLEATMTANKYVADIGTFAPAAQLRQTDDITVYGLDYRSMKDLPRLPKRRPSVVGVGLLTTPSQPVKQSDTAPSDGSSPQWFPSLPKDKLGTVDR